jgi:hypothetical protein
MGLYGVQKKDASLGIAYTGAVYAQEVTLLYSEIDPALHAAIAAGTYGPNPAPPSGWLTSTIDFAPKYFLVNGAPYTAGLLPIPVGKAGQRILFRFLNAGLRDYVPLFQGLHISILAEDGRLLPNPKNQYSLLLPAGKTVDAIAISTVTAGGTVPVYDRRLNLTNNLLSPGGMLTFLQIGAADATTIGVYRPSTSTFLLKDGNVAGLPDYNFAFGIAGDIPLAGDWDGNGTTTIGVYRPSNQKFYLRNSNDTGIADIPPFQYGIPGDIPIAGDWDGNGTTTIGVYRPTNAKFYLRNTNSTGFASIGFYFGIPGDIPIIGNWDGLP